MELGPAEKLLVSMYAGYAISTLYLHLIKKFKSLYQYIYFISTALVLFYWNFGWDIKHPIATITAQWVLMHVFGGNKLCIFFSFVVQMGYYLIGIYLQVKDENGYYPFNWLSTQCVLVLRLIGLAFDYYDGKRSSKESITDDQKSRAIYSVPNLFEMHVYAFFPSAFLIGPQFPLTRLRNLVEGKLIPDGKVTNSERYKEAIGKFLAGTSVLASTLFLSKTFDISFYSDPAFKEYSFIEKWGYVMVTGHMKILTYMALWCINEFSCVIIGISDEYDAAKDEVSFSAVINSKMGEFFKITRFQHVIPCYNINTNGWVLRYIHRRLRFLNARAFSQFVVLMFLAVWHGFYPGYFTAFMYQFLALNTEKQIIKSLNKIDFVKKFLSTASGGIFSKIVGFIYVHFFFGYATIDFSLLMWHKFSPVYSDLYWLGHVTYLALFLLAQTINVTCYLFKSCDKHDAGSAGGRIKTD